MTSLGRALQNDWFPAQLWKTCEKPHLQLVQVTTLLFWQHQQSSVAAISFFIPSMRYGSHIWKFLPLVIFYGHMAHPDIVTIDLTWLYTCRAAQTVWELEMYNRKTPFAEYFPAAQQGWMRLLPHVPLLLCLDRAMMLCQLLESYSEVTWCYKFCHVTSGSAFFPPSFLYQFGCSKIPCMYRRLSKIKNKAVSLKLCSPLCFCSACYFFSVE